MLENLHLREKKNIELADIAYLQSHIMRAPVANIIGIIQLMQDEGIKESDKSQLYKDLLISAKALDDLIPDVSNKAHQAKTN